jgi:hypothetical protein
MSQQFPPVDVKSLKVAELKEELSKRGLDTKGLDHDDHARRCPAAPPLSLGWATSIHTPAYSLVGLGRHGAVADPRIQLADRLQAAQDLAISGGSETAPLPPSLADEAVPLAPPSHLPETAPNPDAATVHPEPSEPSRTQPAASPHPAPTVETPYDKHDFEGVGHPMVEGAMERAEEIREEVMQEEKELEELEPRALDPEVARIVAEEEAKEMMSTTPTPPKSISPLPPSGKGSPRIAARPVDESNGELVQDQEGGEEDNDVLMPDTDLSAGAEPSSRKRSRSPSPVQPPKRPKKTYSTPLPPKLSHLVHPPTSTLYITNLRRPLLHAALHAFLFPSEISPPTDRLPIPRTPFAGGDYPGLWLSGVKDHAYATYPSERDAIAAAERIERSQWPEDTGEKLHVEFVDDDRVIEFVDREEFAWSNGRQKLNLHIKKGEDGEVKFDFTVAGLGGPMPRSGLARGPGGPGGPVGAPPPVPPHGPGSRGGMIPPGRPGVPHLSGANATGARGPGARVPGAPTGPSNPGPGPGPERGGFGIRGGGRGGYGPPPHMGRGNGYGGREEGRLGKPLNRTRTRPSLAWREGPGARA